MTNRLLGNGGMGQGLQAEPLVVSVRVTDVAMAMKVDAVIIIVPLPTRIDVRDF